MEVLEVLDFLEALEPKVCLELLVWMDSMASVDPKVFLEHQVGVQEVAQVLLVFQGRREREASPTQEVQAFPEQREKEEIQVLLDSQGSPVGPDLLVGLWGPIFPDLWETLASLDWMESMVSKVLPVLLVRLVQAQLRETEVTPGSQASQAPLAGKEIQEAPEPLEAPVALDLKENEVRLVSAEVLVSKVLLATLVTMDSKDPREFEDLLVVRVSLE